MTLATSCNLSEVDQNGEDWSDPTPVIDVSDLTCARFTEPVEEREGYVPAQERAA